MGGGVTQLISIKKFNSLSLVIAVGSGMEVFLSKTIF